MFFGRTLVLECLSCPRSRNGCSSIIPCNMLVYHPGGVEMLLLASQYWNWREEPTYSIEQSTSLKWRLICKPFVNTILFITVFQIIPKALEENMESKRKESIRSVQSVMSCERFFLNRFMHLFDCVFLSHKSALDYNYEGKTEVHASQKGQWNDF